MSVIFMTSSLTKRFKMSLTLSNKGNKKIYLFWLIFFIYTVQLFSSIISKDFHFFYNMACLKKLIQLHVLSLFFSVGLVFQGAFSFCNRCASPCRTEERRRQYLVGGYFAIIIQAMFERATKLRRLTWRYLCCM